MGLRWQHLSAYSPLLPLSFPRNSPVLAFVLISSQDDKHAKVDHNMRQGREGGLVKFGMFMGFKQKRDSLTLVDFENEYIKNQISIRSDYAIFWARWRPFYAGIPNLFA